METNFIFLGSKITPDGDFSHEVKRHLLLGSKAMTNLESIFKSRDITLLTKVCLVKAMVFSSSQVWMWDWTIKKAGPACVSWDSCTVGRFFTTEPLEKPQIYGCESWAIEMAEYQRTDVFELWYWRRLLRVPWTARRSKQSILKEISPGCSLEGLMLKLKPQYFGHLMWRTDSVEKTLMLGKIEGRRRRGWQDEMVG